MIGFGSGIYHRKHHESLFKLLDKLLKQKIKKAFIFTTNGTNKDSNKPLREK